MDYAQARDEELVLRLGSRDDRALEELYGRYSRAVYSLAARILRDSARAEETAQEVFLRLWRRPESYVSGRGAFATWILRVTHNRAIDLLRASRVDLLPLEGDVAARVEESGASLDLADLAGLREQRGAVRLALTGLPVPQRQAIELAYFGGLTQREIADRLGEPIGTIKTRTRLALQKLRSALDAADGVHGHPNGAATAGEPVHLVTLVDGSPEGRRADV